MQTAIGDQVVEMQNAISGQEVEAAENATSMQAVIDGIQAHSELMLKNIMEVMHVQAVNVEERLLQKDKEIEKLKTKVEAVSQNSDSMQASQDFVLNSIVNGRGTDEDYQGKGGQCRRGLASPTELVVEKLGESPTKLDFQSWIEDLYMHMDMNKTWAGASEL